MSTRHAAAPTHRAATNKLQRLRVSNCSYLSIRLNGLMTLSHGPTFLIQKVSVYIRPRLRACLPQRKRFR